VALGRTSRLTKPNSIVEDGITVEADRDKLLRVFENLFRNSVEHGGRSVTVEVGRKDDRRGFYVQDDGPGFDNPDEVFDGISDGAGLGTWIANGIAEAHDWSAKAENSDEGGARLIFET